MGSPLEAEDLADIPDWGLAAVFKAKCLEGRIEWTPTQKTALLHAWNELAFLHGQQCKYCGGYGHVKRVCPTKRKLSVLGKQAAVVRNRLAKVTAELDIALADHVVGRPARLAHAPALSALGSGSAESVAQLSGKKRPRTR